MLSNPHGNETLVIALLAALGIGCTPAEAPFDPAAPDPAAPDAAVPDAAVPDAAVTDATTPPDATAVPNIPADWSLTTTENSPPGRNDNAMAFDSTRERVVMFGGGSLSGPHLGTWEFDGVNWLDAEPAVSPSARGGHTMAFDSARDRVVLFGGRPSGGGDDLADTWEYDGSTWVATTPMTSPPSRVRQGMAYDSTRARVVLFGGLSFTASEFQPADTWEYDGSSWTQIATSSAPPGRSDHAMVFDSARHRIVLFGGERETFDLSDTWEFDGGAWTHIATTSAPPPRSVMAYDSSRQRTVAFGTDGTTWEYDGLDWTETLQDSAPTERFRPAMAYDSVREQTVLFGGMEVPQAYSNDTWRYAEVP